MLEAIDIELGVSMGQSGSGLCLTHNRPAYIRWTVERPAANCRWPWVESDRSPMNNYRVSQPRYWVTTIESLPDRNLKPSTSPNLSKNHKIQAKIEAKTTTSSPDLSKNFRSSPDLSKIQSKSTISSLDLSKIFISPPDLSKKTKIFTVSNQKLPNFSPKYQWIWTNLGKFSLLS